MEFSSPGKGGLHGPNKQMCELRRHESVVEKIPWMELEEVNCKLTTNTKAKPKDGTEKL